MKLIKITLYIVVFILFNFKLIAQNLVAFPTPEAAELGKYGQVPVSFFNGLPEISIPIYTLQCKDIEVPISLSYYAQGNKPDEHPSWVGLGWNLNAGGMITRVVNGYRDEIISADFYNELGKNVNTNNQYGYYYRANELSASDWYTELLYKIGGIDYLYYNLDTEPDEFIFNFNGHSGSFYFVNVNGQMQVKVKSKNGEILKVESILFPGQVEFPVFENNYDFHHYNYKLKVFKTFQKFTVTTIDGNKYEFGESIDKIDFTTSSSGITSASSWHLSKITSPNGDYVDFEYKKGGTVFIQKKANYSYTALNSLDNETACTPPINNSNIDGLSMAILHPKYLSKITTSKLQVINFVSTKSTELDYSNWDPWSSIYSGSLAALLPNIVWVNERLNDHYYLKLDRIEIENLKFIHLFYTNSALQRLRLQGLSVTPVLDIDNMPQDLDNDINKYKYSFFYNAISLPAYNSRLTDNWGFYNNNSYSSITPINYSTMYDIRSPELNYAKAEILEKIKYPTGGTTPVLNLIKVNST